MCTCIRVCKDGFRAPVLCAQCAHTHLHKCTFTYLYALVNYTHTDLPVLVYAGVVVAHADA